MTGTLETYGLWRATLGPQQDLLDHPRETLRQSFSSFRGRVEKLVSAISNELPSLTVHDITHLDALWRVAEQIAGDNYPINPAEAYVLGGAFLLHDAAHVLAAYPGRMAEIRQTAQWQDLIAQRYDGRDPERDSAEEKSAIFQVLRHLHAEQAHRLATLSWRAPGSSEALHLIENFELRHYYADLIGEIAASHHWSPAKVASVFRNRRVSCPAFLGPATWEVDALKVAFLLRTADAAHLDDGRAPWFLFALQQPQGISNDHWRFQAKLGQPTRVPSGELRLSSGSSFGPHERSAWWLAYDSARMVDRELRAAQALLVEERRQPFAASSVLGVESAEAFARHVPVSGWQPVDVAPKVGDLPRLIGTLGGTALYGDDLSVPLRELLQNGCDAVQALRALGGLSANEGEVTVSAVRLGDEWLLSVTDTGIGMGRHVLTDVLLDFGNSLWSSDAVREEHPGLVRTAFKPVGKFGIGFFSVFMLGNDVRVISRRFQPAGDEVDVHWELRFEGGLAARPGLMIPSTADRLPRPGTKIEVKVSDAILKRLLAGGRAPTPMASLFSSVFKTPTKTPEPTDDELSNQLGWLTALLCPASLVGLRAQVGQGKLYRAVVADDWGQVDESLLLQRSQSAKAALFPLHDTNGKLIGRVGLPAPDSDNSACIAYQGISNGRMRQLSGLVFARENSRDASRAEASPGGDKASWTRWAKRILAESPHLTREQKLTLHPLVPDLDLPVWLWGGKEVTLQELIPQLKDVEKLLVHSGDTSHKDGDDANEHDFKHYFKVAEGVICEPNFGPRIIWPGFFYSAHERAKSPEFPWAIGFESINYSGRLVSALEAIWGSAECTDESDVPVGQVNGSEIFRDVEVYQRALID
nr:hypothetical protein [uncultured Albidiferax sp.]